MLEIRNRFFSLLSACNLSIDAFVESIAFEQQNLALVDLLLSDTFSWPSSSQTERRIFSRLVLILYHPLEFLFNFPQINLETLPGSSIAFIINEGLLLSKLNRYCKLLRMKCLDDLKKVVLMKKPITVEPIPLDILRLFFHANIFCLPLYPGLRLEFIGYIEEEIHQEFIIKAKKELPETVPEIIQFSKKIASMVCLDLAVITPFVQKILRGCKKNNPSLRKQQAISIDLTGS